MAKNSGIFLIEDRALDPRASAKPFLKTLQWYALQWYDEVQVKHHRAADSDELLMHVEEWAGSEDWTYSILYFWGHGSPNALWLGNEGKVSLEKISTVIARTCEGTELVHFGACETLRGTNDDFLQASGVAAVSGYRTAVDWIDSLAFEMLYMSRIQKVMSKMEAEYLTPDVMNKVWTHLNEDDGPTRNLVDHLHFDLRKASSTKG